MKIGYVLLDGCGDRPDPRLNFTTPLESAKTPNLDALASKSSLGRVITVGRGIAPESDIAVFNMLGYSFDEGYPGRGVVEAVGADVPFKNGDLAFRTNLASVKGRIIVDRRAGRNITQDEAKELEREVNTLELKGAEFEYKATVGYRGVLVIKSEEALRAALSNTDPAYARVGGFGAARKLGKRDVVMKCVPEDRTAPSKRAAAMVNEFVEKAIRLLGKSRLNRERVAAGKMPANCLLIRDAGDHLPEVMPFEEKYGMKGVALVEMPAEVGIARLLRMKMASVADRNDVKAKTAVFESELRENTVAYVHIKGPDEFGHDGDSEGKRRCIEEIDRDFFATAREKRDDVVFGVSCDHATPCALKMHSSDPVPLLITAGKGDGLRFTERNSAKGSLGLLKGRDVLARVRALG